MSYDEVTEALTLTARVAKLMLSNGAASFRTEDTVHRIAAALQLENLNTFITPTGIILTINNQNRNLGQTLKITSLGVNMSRISALETLSRNMPAHATAAEIAHCVDQIEAEPSIYSMSMVVIGVGLACGCFAVIQGGGPLEFIAAAIAAGIAQRVRLRLSTLHTNPYLLTAICSALATFTSYLLTHLLMAPSPRLAIIASVLLMVPGVPLITSMLDIIQLDLISGVSRGIYAVSLLLNIGIGMLIVLVLTGFAII